MPATPSEAEVRRLHPLTPFFDLILFGRQLAVPLVFAIVAGRDRGNLFLLIPALGGTAFGLLRWLRFTYTLDGRRLVIDQGVFTRKQRVVPLDRIQQVELVSKLRHRLVGVTVLRVDTAGGGESPEIDLSVVSVAEATRLRSLLLPDEQPSFGPRPASVQQPAQNELVRLGAWPLAVGGMTGSELAVMLTVLFWFVQLVDDLPDGVLSDVLGDLAAPASVGGFVVGALALLVLWFGLAAVAGVVKNFGFTMVQSGRDLRVSRGLLDRREGSMPLHRLQAVRIQQSIVRRALGLAEVVLQSAGGASGSSKGVARIDVPIIERRRATSLLAVLLPATASTTLDDLVPAPPIARRRAIVRRVLVVLVAAVAAIALVRSPSVVAASVVALVVAGVAGELAYQGLGHRWADGVLVARSGGLARETVVVPGAKAQSTRLRTTPLQRRAGLATLSVDIAGKGRTPLVRDGDAATLRLLQTLLAADPVARRDENEVRLRSR